MNTMKLNGIIVEIDQVKHIIHCATSVIGRGEWLDDGITDIISHQSAHHIIARAIYNGQVVRAYEIDDNGQAVRSSDLFWSNGRYPLSGWTAKPPFEPEKIMHAMLTIIETHGYPSETVRA